MSNLHSNGQALSHDFDDGYDAKRKQLAAQTAAMLAARERFASLSPKELLSPASIMTLHQAVFGSTLENAGQLRNRSIRLAWHIPSAQSAEELQEALQDYSADCLRRVELVKQRPEALPALLGFTFWKLVYIAPFHDGNGRVANLLVQLLLQQYALPPHSVYERSAADYGLFLDCLRAYDAGNATPFFTHLTRRLQLERPE